MVLTLCFHERHRDRGQSHFSTCKCKIDLSQSFTPGIECERDEYAPDYRDGLCNDGFPGYLNRTRFTHVSPRRTRAESVAGRCIPFRPSHTKRRVS